MHIFERVEKKYLVDKKTFDLIYTKMLEYMDEDQYGWETIYNVYFDDDYFTLINKSIQKPIFKQKLRLRSYKSPNDDDKVFFEIKKKYKGVVYKRRITTEYKNVINYLKNGKEISNDLTFKEIDYFIKSFKLEPKVFIAYDRIALYGKDDPNLRITFDKKIRSRFNNISLKLSDEDDVILDDGNMLMEIKVLNSMPLWLTKLLNDYKIYPTSFSKYGKIYESKLENKDKNKSDIGGNICLIA